MDDAAFYQRIDLLDEDDVIDAESPVILDDGTGHSRLASALPVVRRVTAVIAPLVLWGAFYWSKPHWEDWR